MTASKRTAAAAPWRVVLALGVTQITAWGSIYYVFALLLSDLQVELNASKPLTVGAFSVALLVTGLLAPLVGRWIDRHGGRQLMTAGSILGGVGLVLLGRISSVAELYAVWTLLGVAMAATLYDPAFAVVTRVFAGGYRKAISVLTLFGGLASTVFWPLTQLLIEQFGWRDAVALLGLLQILLCAPLHAWALPGRETRPAVAAATSGSRNLRQVLAEPVFYLLCAAFTINALVFSAMTVHMLPMLVAKGMTPLQAAGVGAMFGPMQVLGRLVEMLFGSRLRATHVGLVSMAMLPASLVVFYLLGSGTALFIVFAFLFGAGNGVTTIARGAIPAEIYGRDHYGAVNGAMGAPVMIAKASGPLLAAIIWSITGNYAVLALALAAVSAASVLLLAPALRVPRAAQGAAPAE